MRMKTTSRNLGLMMPMKPGNELVSGNFDGTDSEYPGTSRSMVIYLF